MSRSLAEIRDEIDLLDRELQSLVNRRAALAHEVAMLKIDAGENPAGFYRPEREAQILREVISRNQGPLSSEAISRIFREMMSACLALEMPMNVAFLGPEGTYTHAAMTRHFGGFITPKSCLTIDAVFHLVASEQAHYGVVPLENSSEGLISQTFDALISSSLQVCGEVQLRINHNLLGMAKHAEPSVKAPLTESSKEAAGEHVINTNLGSKIKKIYAHPQSLGQCRRWIERHLPHAEQVMMSSNALAALKASSEGDAVAIASETAGRRYGLTTLARHIEDQADNMTRFIMIGRTRPRASGHDKTMIAIKLKQSHQGQLASGLYEPLRPLMDREIPVVRMESRSTSVLKSEQSASEVDLLLLDLEGHIEDQEIMHALEEVKKLTLDLKILGAYPQPLPIFDSERVTQCP